MRTQPKLAFMASLGYSQMEPQEVLTSLSSLGYQGVEWPLAFFNPRAKSGADRKRLVEMTKEHGLEVSELVVQQDLVELDDDARSDKIALVVECIEAAAELGGGPLNLFTGPAPWAPTAPRIPDDISEGAAWDMVLDAFDRFVEVADKCEVSLAVEGVWGMLCHDFYTTKFLIEEFDSEWLGVNLDPSHDVLVGNFDSGWIASQWDTKIRHVHLKDAVGIAEQGKFLFPLLGEGRVDWAGFFRALDDLGYEGFMSVEFESFEYYRTVLKGDVEQAARMSMMQIEELMKSAE